MLSFSKTITAEVLEGGGDINNDRMDDLGEEFTIKFVNDFCNVKRSVGDTAAKGLS